MTGPEEPWSARLEEVYRSESRRVLATLIRLLGDFDLAEDALHDAFRAAAESWPRDGEPVSPRAWLVSTGRFKAIDALRRRARFDEAQHEIADRLEAASEDAAARVQLGDLEDDRLRLVFTCCHPALSPEAQVALTLREICGLTTEEIARAFLTYLVFNEGYSASSGDSVTRADLSGEAIRLGRLLVELLPDAEVEGLLALMLLHDARRRARSAPDGTLVLLHEQDRSRWNREQIVEGLERVRRALATSHVGPFAVQAAISAVHAAAPDAAATDWREIVALYDVLLRLEPSPVVELNRAVAVAMHDGPAAGLALVDRILERGELVSYRFAHATRADLCRRLGRTPEARAAYRRALELTLQESERRFLERRLAELA